MPRPAACLALLLTCASPTKADIVTYQLTGTTFTAHEPVTGSFRYDTSAPDLVNSQFVGQYHPAGSFEVTAGGHTFRDNPSLGFYVIVAYYPDAPGRDTFRILADSALEDGRPTGDRLALSFSAGTADVPPGIGLPTSVDADDYVKRFGGTPQGPGGVFVVDTITATPEPSTFVLLGLGGAALAARGLRRLTH